MIDPEKVLAGLEACADLTGALCRTCPRCGAKMDEGVKQDEDV